jgi:hypothetical protein
MMHGQQSSLEVYRPCTRSARPSIQSSKKSCILSSAIVLPGLLSRSKVAGPRLNSEPAPEDPTSLLRPFRLAPSRGLARRCAKRPRRAIFHMESTSAYGNSKDCPTSPRTQQGLLRKRNPSQTRPPEDVTIRRRNPMEARAIVDRVPERQIQNLSTKLREKAALELCCASQLNLKNLSTSPTIAA